MISWVLTCPKVRCSLITITSLYLPDFFSVSLWIELDGRIVSTGFPRWLSRQRICLQCRRPGFDPWVGKIPWRREWLPTPGFLPGESPWIEGWLGLENSMACIVHGVTKSGTQLNDFYFTSFHFIVSVLISWLGGVYGNSNITPCFGGKKHTLQYLRVMSQHTFLSLSKGRER